MGIDELITHEEIVISLLRASTTVKDLSSNRIFGGEAPGPELRYPMPFIVVNRQNVDHENNMDGASGIRNSRIEVAVYSKWKDTLEDLGEQCRLALHGFTGSVTVGDESLTIRKMFLDTDEATKIPPLEGQSAGTWFLQQIYNVGSAEAVPTF